MRRRACASSAARAAVNPLTILVPPRSAAIIGSPPFFRGGPDPGRDLELKLLKNFPSVAMFVEKPVASGQPFRESIEGAMKIAQILEDRGNVVSVGYMLRYLSCVQQMKKIIAENNLTVMATNARYVCAYEAIAKPVRPAPASVWRPSNSSSS